MRVEQTGRICPEVPNRKSWWYTAHMGLRDDNSKVFLRQMEQEEIPKDFWAKLKKGGGEYYLWKKGQVDPYRIGVDYETSAKLDFKGIAIKVPAEFVELFKSHYRQINIFLKFKFGDLQYFTSGEIDWSDASDSFVVRRDHPVFVTTRRSACRYESLDIDRIHVTSGEHAFSCFDISSGGFSTVVPKSKYGDWGKGTTLDGAELRFNLKRFQIPKITIVNIIEVKGKPDLIKLAFKFDGLRSSIEDSIWVEVNSAIKRLADLLG